jgi:hypothetical protein
MYAQFRFTALVAVLLATQQACASPTSGPAASGGLGSAPSASPSGAPSSPPSSSPAKTTKTSAPASAKSVLSGERQVYFFVLDKGQEVPEAVLGVTSSSRVTVTGDYGSRALFVPIASSPGGKEHLIETGKLRDGGEALCLKIRNNGSNPLTVVTAACDTGDKTQMFRFDESGKDNQGRMTYAIRNRDAFLQWNPTGTDGLIAEEIGDSKLNTTFVLVDRGKSTVPQLG